MPENTAPDDPLVDLGQADRTPPDDHLVEFGHRMLDLARSGDPELLDHVDARLSVDLTGPDGDTLLMLAARHGHADVVAGLAARGADLDRRNDHGRTPLAEAVVGGSEEVVDVLVEAGADPDAGRPTARAVARAVDQDGMAARLDASEGGPGGDGA